MAYVHKPGTTAYRKLERTAIGLGASKFGISSKGYSKYFVIYKGRTIHLGDRRFEDFSIHKDIERRDNYRARHSKILLKNGTPAYTVKGTPAYFSYWILWS
jgi:hypothetical protein